MKFSTTTKHGKQGLGATVMARLAAEPVPDGIQVKSLPVPLESDRSGNLGRYSTVEEVFAFLDILKDTW